MRKPKFGISEILLDKNGKEIQEGDICKAFDHTGKEWIALINYNERFGTLVFDSNYPTALHKEYSKNFEIIGNIDFNPELLIRG